MLKGTRDAVAAAIERRQIARSDEAGSIPGKSHSGDFIGKEAFLETFYNSLSGLERGKFIPHN
jgi:hypothetical protein